MSHIRFFLVLCTLLLLASCASKAHIRGAQPGTTISLRGTQLELPIRHSLRSTSFGNYEFKAQAAGLPDFYGILPLQFKGGHLALDILFLAPAAMFNLRGAFPYYEIDVAEKTIRFRNHETDPWTSISPKLAEAERARTYFGGAAAAE